MDKSVNYTITLYPAYSEGGFVVTKYEMMGNYPEQELPAADLPDLVDKVIHFAIGHGEGSRVSDGTAQTPRDREGD